MTKFYLSTMQFAMTSFSDTSPDLRAIILRPLEISAEVIGSAVPELAVVKVLPEPSCK